MLSFASIETLPTLSSCFNQVKQYLLVLMLLTKTLYEYPEYLIQGLRASVLLKTDCIVTFAKEIVKNDYIVLLSTHFIFFKCYYKFTYLL